MGDVDAERAVGSSYIRRSINRTLSVATRKSIRQKMKRSVSPRGTNYRRTAEERREKKKRRTN